MRIDPFSLIYIDQIRLATPSFVNVDDNIFRLEIPMENMVAMELGKCFC